MSDYTILIALENIFKEDYRTKKYIVQSAEEPDNVPSPDICPMINLFPSAKERDLTRMSGTPYTASLTFDVIMWEMSAGDFKNAFKLISAVEENVFQVLLANKNVNGNVLTSTIGATTYEHVYHESCFYVKATMPFIVMKNQ